MSTQTKVETVKVIDATPKWIDWLWMTRMFFVGKTTKIFEKLYPDFENMAKCADKWVEHSKKQSVNVTVSEQQRGNMLVGAIEGGSNYWYEITIKGIEEIERFVPSEFKDQAFSVRLWNAIKAGAEIPVHSSQEGKRLKEVGKISLASIAIGEQSMADNYLHHFCDIVQETDDATTADIWFQLAVMSDVVYG